MTAVAVSPVPAVGELARARDPPVEQAQNPRPHRMRKRLDQARIGEFGPSIYFDPSMITDRKRLRPRCKRTLTVPMGRFR